MPPCKTPTLLMRPFFLKYCLHLGAFQRLKKHVQRKRAGFSGRRPEAPCGGPSAPCSRFSASSCILPALVSPSRLMLAPSRTKGQRSGRRESVFA